MSKKIVLAGHCGPDSSYLRMSVAKAVKDARIIMADDDELKADGLIFSPLESARVYDDEPKELHLSTIEKNTILRVIEKHHGNISKAAKELGLTRTALYRRLSKYDI